LVTYHPNDGSFTHSSLGWVGLYGTLTGYSESNLAISEKVWYAYKKLDNIYGYPWTFMLQDMLRFDPDIDSCLARLGESVRTCAIWLGLGQGARPNPHQGGPDLPANFRLVEDSFEELAFWNPETFPTYAQHSYFPGVLFVNKHVQPSKDSCMNDLITQYYGSLTALDVFQSITALQQTGDMHIAVADFDNKMYYVANAKPMPDNQPAYGNGFISFNMTALWQQQPPTVEN